MIEEAESRVMGIDFGLKRIGIALSDSLKMFAYAHTTILNNSNVFVELEKIIKEKNVIKFILGIPNENRVSKTSVVNDIKNFKDKLENKFLFPVVLWDETYTSAMAQERIIESVNKKQKRKNKGLVDMHAAAIILQEYLDTIKTNN